MHPAETAVPPCFHLQAVTVWLGQLSTSSEQFSVHSQVDFHMLSLHPTVGQCLADLYLTHFPYSKPQFILV